MYKQYKYIIGITFAFLVLLVNQIYIQYSITQIEDNASIINRAGYQRMLSQRIALTVQKNTDRNRTYRLAYELFAKWKTQHYTIVEQPFTQNTIREFQISGLIQQLEDDIQVVEDLIGSGILSKKELDDFHQTITHFLETMDKTVGFLEQYSNQQLDRLKLIEIVLFIISVLLLIGELLFVFKPAQNELKRMIQELGKQNRQLEKSNELVLQQKTMVDRAYQQLDKGNTEVLESIRYAKKIQSAILPSEKLLKKQFNDFFIFHKPKEIISGDFYWSENSENKRLFAVADCSGRGVSGAMISLICINSLNRVVREHGLTEPGQILNKTREFIIAEFEKSEEKVKEGMNIGLCSLEDKTLKFAGAKHSLLIIRRKESTATENTDDQEPNSSKYEVEIVKGHTQSIARSIKPSPYSTHTFELNKGDTVYLYSNGFADQFLESKGEKLKKSDFQNLLIDIQEEEMVDQKGELEYFFENWKEKNEQLDDVCILGIRI